MRLALNRRPFIVLSGSLLLLGVVVIGRFAMDTTRTQRGDIILDAPIIGQVTTEQMITQYQDHLRMSPEDTTSYAALGWSFVQLVRETADASLYARAEAAFSEALKRDPQQLDAITGMGSLALSRHHFADAIRWGEQALAITPYRAQIYGIIADGQTELGRYDEAVATLQKMVDTRPDANAYSRISYARELHGDVDGATEAMTHAASSGAPQAEGTLWSQVQLGNLYFSRGDESRAETAYQQALQVKPDYVYAQAGMARILVAHGDYTEAISAYRRIVERLPLPEFVIALGELYEVTGQTVEAKGQYDLVRAIEQLYASAGVNVDMEMALFEADHGGDPLKVVAQAREAFSLRPTLYASDTFAWALYKAGNYSEARNYSVQALRLGTQDALLHYHAAMIDHALGDNVGTREHLQKALAINPAFSIRYSSQARDLLAKLMQAGS